MILFASIFSLISALYKARHSWATIAAALGDELGNPTTSIYIDFNMKKVDEANRRVIDRVLYGKK